MSEQTEVPVEELSGRALDAAVAEEVMGLPRPSVPTDNRALPIWEPQPLDGWLLTTTGYGSGDELIVVPKPYSTGIAAAWEVLAEVRSGHCEVELGTGPEDEGVDAWVCDLTFHGYRPFQTRHFTGVAKTAPLAICRAALKAVRSEPDPPRAA